MDRAVVCEESLIWFEGLPVVVGGEPMAAGLFYCSNISLQKRRRSLQECEKQIPL